MSDQQKHYEQPGEGNPYYENQGPKDKKAPSAGNYVVLCDQFMDERFNTNTPDKWNYEVIKQMLPHPAGDIAPDGDPDICCHGNSQVG
jgi:hypothetical protein